MNNTFLFIIMLAFVTVSCKTSQQQGQIFFVGTMEKVDQAKHGIHMCSLNPQNGQIKKLGQVTQDNNASFLALHPNKQFLYAVNATKNKEDQVDAFKINRAENKLEPINNSFSGGKSACHLAVDAKGNYVFTANYGGGGSMHILHENGRLNNKKFTVQHEGSGPHRAQKHSRIHQAVVRKEQVFFTDLGTDQVVVYDIDRSSNALVLNQKIQIPAGSGPRHLCFNNSGQRIYLLNELNATVAQLSVDGAGVWQVDSVYHSLKNKDAKGACADIHLSKDGRFLYTSNRQNYNTISLFAVDKKSGQLTFVEEVETRGETPRNFTLSPDEKFLLVANQNGGNIVVFRRDEKTGRLSYQSEVEMQKATCLLFY